MGKRCAVLMTVAFCLGHLAAGRLSAAHHELPFETVLEGESIRLELRNANLDIVLDADAEASLEVRLLTPGEHSEELLDVQVRNGSIQLARRGQTTVTEARWLVELVVSPEQFVDIVGVDLDVLVEASVEASANDEQELTDRELEFQSDSKSEDEEDKEKESLKAEGRQPQEGVSEDDTPTLGLQVDQSSINLVGVDGVDLDAIESFIHTSGTSGVLRLTIRGGSAEILRHQGPLDISSDKAEVWIEEPEAKIGLELEGGTFNLIGGAGQSKGKVRDAFVRFEGWRGSTLFEASDATLELVSVKEANVQVSGPALEVVVEDIEGMVEANLLGGRLTGRTLGSSAKITARGGAEVEINTIRGSLRLSLEGDAAATITDVGGILQGNIQDSRLEVEGVRQLEFHGLRAEVRLARMERIRLIEATDSRLDIDLSGLRHDPLLTLQGASEASVRIEAPCGVKMEKSGQAQFAQVDVSGCLMHGQSQGRVTFGRRGLQGNRQMMLKLALSPDSSVEVEGLY